MWWLVRLASGVTCEERSGDGYWVSYLGVSMGILGEFVAPSGDAVTCVCLPVSGYLTLHALALLR